MTFGYTSSSSAAVDAERVVLTENARGHERQHRTGLRAGHPPGEEAARLVAVVPAPSAPPVITRMDPLAARIHSGRSTIRASGTGPSVISPVTSRTGGSAARDAVASSSMVWDCGCSR